MYSYSSFRRSRICSIASEGCKRTLGMQGSKSLTNALMVRVQCVLPIPKGASEALQVTLLVYALLVHVHVLKPHYLFVFAFYGYVSLTLATGEWHHLPHPHKQVSCPMQITHHVLGRRGMLGGMCRRCTIRLRVLIMI